jgi:hypothetical protein
LGAAAQAQWAQAISTENEKLHQLCELQRGIIGGLQQATAAAAQAQAGKDPAPEPAQPAAALAEAEALTQCTTEARRHSEGAAALRASLLAHTGHAQACDCTPLVLHCSKPYPSFETHPLSR